MSHCQKFDSKRYEISDTVKSALSVEDCQFMENVCTFLNEKLGLIGIAAGIKGTSAGSATSVLVAIANATLRWHKPIERLTISNFENPRHEDGVFALPLSKSTALRAISVLDSLGLIVRSFSPCGQVVHYGLNLREIFSRVERLLAGKDPRSSHLKNCISRFEELKRSPSFERVCNLLQRFKGLVIRGINEVNQILTEVRKKVGDLISTVKTAKKRAAKRSAEKATAKSAQPLFDPRTGKANAAAALAFWHKAVKDTENFEHYTQTMTPKVLRMMRLWLEECHRDGWSEEKIRDNIVLYVRKWDHVPAEDRELTLISKNSLPYTRRMTDYPNFEFFYVTRSVLAGVLDRACEPGKYHDGTQRERISDLPSGYFLP